MTDNGKSDRLDCDQLDQAAGGGFTDVTGLSTEIETAELRQGDGTKAGGTPHIRVFSGSDI